MGGANMDIYICAKIVDRTSVRSTPHALSRGVWGHAFPHEKILQIWPIESEFRSTFE